jgi:acyl-CoA synthetase (AMP-forming)/AMP-acid ligase II
VGTRAAGRGGLAARVVRPGDRVAIILPNGPGWLFSFLGTVAAGAVAVPVNTRFTDAEAGYVVSDSGARLTIGPGVNGAGELLVRGPQLMSGYWNRPDATARALSGGWLHTGDIARITADGAVQLLDRRDDVVNRGGENVYCTEVENALAARPAVAEVAVVGVPGDALGAKVAAAVVPLAGVPVTPAAVVEFARGVLADFKVPQYVSVRAGPLPRNAGGKVIKSVIRDGTDWGPALW